MNKIITTTLLLITFFGAYGQYVKIDSASTWATTEDKEVVSTVDKYDIQNGYYYTQFDQITHTPSMSHFLRYKTKVINSAGIDYLSQINIEIDTAFQKVTFHSLKIHRKNNVLDRTAKLDLKLINNEENLASNIINGTMLVNAVLSDIRKNDEIEVAYTVTGQNPIYENNIHGTTYLEFMNHIDYLTYKLIFPKDSIIHTKIKDITQVNLKKYTIDTDSIYEIQSENIEPIVLEELMSFSENPFNNLEYSNHSDWKSVNKWASQLFKETSSTLLDSLYKSIVGNENNVVSKATLIMDYVQNEIRYTSINGGIGSFLPTSPDEVIERNYGDCKDKTLLTIQLLRKAGVKYAVPALVNSSSGRFLNQYLPGHTHFDHVIIKAKIADKVVWIDPSLYLQGGKVTDRHSYYYGYALVIDGASSKLEKMNIDSDINRTEVIETFNVKNTEGVSTLNVQTKFFGKSADYIRSMLDHYSLSDLEQQFKQVYSTIFLEVTALKKLKIDDDYENNIILMSENYEINNIWKKVEEQGKTGYILSYEPMNMYNYVYPQSCDKIKFMIDIDKTLSFSQVTRFNLPDDTLYKLNNFETDNSIYKLQKNQKILSINSTEISYELNYKSNQITPDEYFKYCEDANQDARNLLLNMVWVEK